MRRLTLTRRFAVVSLLAVAAIGVVLTGLVSRIVQQQAEDEAIRAAELLTRFVEVQLTDSAFDGGNLGFQERRALDLAASNAGDGAGLVTIRLWSRSGQVLYDSDREVVGRTFPVTGSLAAAVRGQTQAEIEKAGDDHPSGAGELLEVYAPVRAAGGVRIDGALEVYLSYDETRAQAADASRQIAAVLVAGLALLWLLMWQLSRRVSQRLRADAAHQEHLARHDSLTGLPNRRMLLNELQEVLDAASTATLLLLDIDRFKEINDSLGHHIGDLLLREIGPRIAAAAPDGALVARLGGDEFAVLVPGIGELDDALLEADAVIQVFDEPFTVGELLLQVDPSVGVACAPLHADDAATLLQRADVAMYDAKISHARVAPYRAESDVNTPERLQLLADLRHALSGGDGLRLDYQPIVSVRTGAVLGVEALLRWDHPTRGAIPPVDFVGTAERTGLIRPLTRFVLDQAIGQCRRWLDDGLRLTVAVNLSARNLAEPDLPSAVSAALARHQVPAELLVLEITESAVIDEPDQAEHVVRRLVDLGLGMSLDDFGTGYSSMATLMQLPLRSLKVDRSFVGGLDRFSDDGGESRGAVITRATIAMAQQLGLSVVAEGVESEAQLEQLRELGCDAAQGFLLSRPTSPAKVAEYVRSTATLRPSEGRRRGPA